MMAFSFREFTNLLNKSKRLPEVAKSEAPLNAASFLGQLPVWGLCTKELSLLARERRYSPATGSTGFISKSFGHVACPSCQASPELSWQTAKFILRSPQAKPSESPESRPLLRPASVDRSRRAPSASITRAGIWREVLEFIRLSLPLLRVRRGRFFARDIWPGSRVFRVQWQPLLGARLGVRLNRIDRTFRLAYPAIDTFVGMNDQHVLTLVEAIHGADFHTIHQLAFDATLIDYVGHKTSLLDGQAVSVAASNETVRRVRQ